jgi:hypothetical protein
MDVWNNLGPKTLTISKTIELSGTQIPTVVSFKFFRKIIISW